MAKDTHTHLSSLNFLYAGLPTNKKMEFLKSSIKFLSSENCTELQKFIDSVLRRDFIALLYEYSQVHLAEKILSYLDASALAAAEQVSSVWCTVIRGGNLWKRLIQQRVINDELWNQLLIRLDLMKYFQIMAVTRSKTNQTMDNPVPTATGDLEDFLDMKQVSRVLNSMGESLDVTSEDYTHQNSDFYRSLYFSLCSLAERISQNWVAGRYKVQRIRCHSDGSRGVYCLQYDSKIIVCGARDGSIQVYDKRTLECERIITGHVGSVLCLQYDDQLLISGSSDSTVRLWNLLSGRNLHTIRHHNSGVFNLKFKKNILITGSRDHTVCIWNILSPTDVILQTALHGHRSSVNAVDFDDRYILSAGGDRIIQVWDFQSHEFVRSLIGHRRSVTCMHYHNGIAVTGSSDLTVRIWTVETGLCTRILEGHEQLVRCLRFDHRWILCGSYDGKIRMWNTPDAMDPNTSVGLLTATTLKEHKNRVFRIEFDSMQIISSSLDNTVIIWDFFTAVDDLVDKVKEIINQARPWKLSNESISSSLASNFMLTERTVTPKPVLVSRLDGNEIDSITASTISDCEFDLT